MRRKPLIEIDFIGEKFDLSPLLGKGELSPQKAKEAIMAAGHEFLRQGRVSHETFIAMDEAASPQEALLYVFNFIAWGTHDVEKKRRQQEEEDEKWRQKLQADDEEMAEYLQEDLRKMKAELDSPELNDWTGQM